MAEDSGGWRARVVKLKLQMSFRCNTIVNRQMWLKEVGKFWSQGSAHGLASVV